MHLAQGVYGLFRRFKVLFDQFFFFFSLNAIIVINYHEVRAEKIRTHTHIHQFNETEGMMIEFRQKIKYVVAVEQRFECLVAWLIPNDKWHLC